MSLGWMQSDRELMGLIIVTIQVGNGDAELINSWLSCHKVLLLAVADRMIKVVVGRLGFSRRRGDYVETGRTAVTSAVRRWACDKSRRDQEKQNHVPLQDTTRCDN